MSSLTWGLTLGWTSPYILKLSKDKTNFDISEEEAAYLPIISAFSMMASCLFFHKLNDIIGRKFTIMLIALPYSLFFVLTGLATNFEMFVTAKLFAGFGDALFHVSVPMYIGEISTPKIRGTWGNLSIISVCFGIFLMNIIGSYAHVTHTSYICLPIPIIFVILVIAVAPESPYYCVMKNVDNKAKKSLRFLRGTKNIDEEFRNLKSDVARQISERGTWIDLFKIPSNRRALTIGMFLRLSQQMSGMIVFIYFNQFIFEKAGTHLSSEISSIIYNGLWCSLTVCCFYTIEKFGRKNTYKYTLLTCGFILFCLSLFFFLDKNLILDLKQLKWFPLVGMIIHITLISFGIGIIPTLMASELYSVSIKVKALSFVTVITALIDFVLGKIFYVLYSNFGLFAPFLLFSISCFISTFLTIQIVPETKGKTLEEVQQILKKNVNIS